MNSFISLIKADLIICYMCSLLPYIPVKRSLHDVSAPEKAALIVKCFSTYSVASSFLLRIFSAILWQGGIL